MTTYGHIENLLAAKYRNYVPVCHFDNPEFRIVDNVGCFTVFINCLERRDYHIIGWTAMATVGKNSPEYSLRIIFDSSGTSYRDAETEYFDSPETLFDAAEKYRREFIRKSFTQYTNRKTLGALEELP